MRTFILLAMTVAAALAQAPKIKTVRALPNATTVLVIFDAPIRGNIYTGPPLTNDCEITEPSGFQRGDFFFDSTDRLRVLLKAPLRPGIDVKVVCGTLDYADSTTSKKTATKLTGTTTVETLVNANATMLALQKEQRDQAKKSSEKDIFASGFVTTASSGTAGGADISVNPDLKIPHLTPFIQIKKTTQEGGDAKHFEAGARYQAFFHSNRKAFTAIRGMGDARPGDILAKFNEENLTKSAYARLFAGSSLDVAAKMEGAAGGFEVTNIVGDAAFTLRSNTAGLLKNRGYFRGFMTPFAIEGGQSHANQQAAAAATQTTAKIKPDWITRYKTGLGFRLFFKDGSGNSLLQRVELSGEGALRNLFFEEAMWDATTKAISKTGKGVRAYGQLDLKIYVGENDRGKFGLKLSYNRGSLPPVFAKVKSFQFGFLWESNEDK